MDNEPKTLAEIAKEFGVSHQRIEQILISAIKKIKKAFEEKGIKIEDLL